jgi:hypothetical protein
MTQLNNGEFCVKRVERPEIKDFIEKHHYSQSINGVMSKYCFAMYKDNELIGAMLYGNLGMANAWKKYGNSEDQVIELRRLVLIDDTPRNSESWFIGWTIRWLKKNTEIKTIVSYADANYGHSGVIYKATNFQHVGMTSKGRVIMHNGKKYHDKTIRTKYKGELKPFAKRLLIALEEGEAYYVKQEPKHIYVMDIR